MDMKLNNKNINGHPMSAMMAQKTNTAVKFIIVMVLGILPLLLCALFITDETMASQFKQWGSQGSQAQHYMDYGFMWLLGIAIYVATFAILILITGLTKEVQLDVVPATSAASLAMLNMFVIPHSHAAFLILSLPAFAIIGYIIGVFVVVIVAIKRLQKQINKAQQDPEFQKMMNDIQKQMGQPGMKPQPGQFNKGKGPNKPQEKDYKDNPYVDVPDDEEEK